MDNRKNERLAIFNKKFMTTKKEVLDEINSAIKDIDLLINEGDRFHSKLFYRALKNVLKEFYKRVEERVFFKLNDYWCYYFAINSSSIFLAMAYYPDFDTEENLKNKYSLKYKERYDLITYRCKELDIKEYAERNETNETTVRQWIRRGKIKQAKKYGNVWKIPELAEYRKNGYRYAGYKWDKNVVRFDDEYSDYKNFDKVIISQDDNNSSSFHIEYQIREIGDIETYKTVKEKKVDIKEKEKIELMLISNIDVEYTGGIAMLYK